MGMIPKLNNKRVFLDTAPLIYYLEENEHYLPVLDKIFLDNSNRKFLFITSVVTLMEILVHPMRLNESDLVEQYQNILCNSATVELVEINIEISRKAAWFRAMYGFKTADAIQLATALLNSADYFLTNDLRFKSIKEIKMLVLEDLLKG